MNPSRWLHAFVDRHFYRGGVFHKTLNVSDVVRRIEADPALRRVVNIGSGGRQLFPRIINVDAFRVRPGDIRALGEALPLLDESVDCVICVAVLEHVRDPQAILREIRRVLKPGGRAYIEVPFLQPFHAAPDDFQRTTLPGLRHWMCDFEEIESGACSGPGSAVAWILVEYAGLFFRDRTLSRLASYATQVLVSPLKYLDKFLMRRPAAIGLASGVYVYGKKPTSAAPLGAGEVG